MIEELLLGDNPFIGISHLAHEKAREAQKELTIERKIEVIEAAVESGATGFTFSTHPANLILLKHVKQKRPDIFEKLNYYILVPYVAGYVREATKTGFPGLIRRVALKCISPSTLISIIPPTPNNFVKLFVEVELKEYMRILPRDNIRAILLHEVLTELVMAFNLARVVTFLNRHFKKQGLGFGLETRNIGCAKSFQEEGKLELEYIMTPLNPLGYQMSPNRELAENAIVSLSRQGVKIIGINILASGAITPDDSLKYLRSFRDYIYAVAFGTSSPQRARETSKKLRSLIQ
ncbi:MAG: hypothetical protein QW096_09105 [Thermofilaceae archaeon]